MSMNVLNGYDGRISTKSHPRRDGRGRSHHSAWRGWLGPGRENGKGRNLDGTGMTGVPGEGEEDELFEQGMEALQVPG
jgi:hypothetical protein